VHAFDPTVGGTPPDCKGNPHITFHKQALGPRTGPSDVFLLVENLLDTMKRNNHTFIDVLKVMKRIIFIFLWSFFILDFKSSKEPLLPMSQDTIHRSHSFQSLIDEELFFLVEHLLDTTKRIEGA
jgi:hypothetical protein